MFEPQPCEEEFVDEKEAEDKVKEAADELEKINSKAR